MLFEQECLLFRFVVGFGEVVWFDFWELDCSFDMLFVEGVYGNVIFMLMWDGVMFDVCLLVIGLVVVFVN